MFYDVIVIGAGAAGLMAATESAKRGRKTLLIEHTNKIGEKIRISGGGRCNFTNLYTTPAQYISQNPHFAKSALAQYTQHDFIKMIQDQGIAYHEKTLGQLFCDHSAQNIIDLFLQKCRSLGVTIAMNCSVQRVSKSQHFSLETSLGPYSSESLVIATGGLSIPQIGATSFGYEIAQQFGLSLIPTRPALVPLKVRAADLSFFQQLSGVAQFASVSYGKRLFEESLLFTHRGLSGPSILQISSYIDTSAHPKIRLNLLPHQNLGELLKEHKNSPQFLSTILKSFFPQRLIQLLADREGWHEKMTDLSIAKILAAAQKLQDFEVAIEGDEGYKKAEVTAGGVDTRCLSSKTMECLTVPKMYFIGEVVDVTGWLGGYNFQWAWSSGFVAGQHC